MLIKEVATCNCNQAAPATLLKKRLWHRCFPVNFAKISKNTFFTEHLWATASIIRDSKVVIADFLPWIYLEKKSACTSPGFN